MINAADAISACAEKTGGRLVIRTETGTRQDDESQDSPVLKIMFIDNGTGICKNDLENIFDPFFSTKEPGKGTGLGLSVCFMIIDQEGGSILAHSEEGKGTTMTVFLPLSR